MAAGEDQTSSSLEEQPRCFREMSYHQRQAGLSPSVTVAVRVRPFLPMEMTESAQQSVLKMHGRRTMLVPLAGGAPSVFSYDYSLWSAGQVGKAKLVEQKDVFRLLGSDVIDQVTHHSSRSDPCRGTADTHPRSLSDAAALLLHVVRHLTLMSGETTGLQRPTGGT